MCVAGGGGGLESPTKVLAAHLSLSLSLSCKPLAITRPIVIPSGSSPPLHAAPLSAFPFLPTAKAGSRRVSARCFFASCHSRPSLIQECTQEKVHTKATHLEPVRPGGLIMVEHKYLCFASPFFSLPTHSVFVLGNEDELLSPSFRQPSRTTVRIGTAFRSTAILAHPEF